MKRKQVLALLNNAGVYPDRFIQKRTNEDASGRVYEVKFHYFYRHGRSPEGYAEQLAALDPRIEILHMDDQWRSWPNDSWMVVIFKLWNSREERAEIQLRTDMVVANTMNREISAWLQRSPMERLMEPYWFDPVLWNAVKTLPAISRVLATLD